MNILIAKINAFVIPVPSNMLSNENISLFQVLIHRFNSAKPIVKLDSFKHLILHYASHFGKRLR